eukprot:4060922-Alexandrium_andersonii.AAC.1
MRFQAVLGRNIFSKVVGEDSCQTSGAARDFHVLAELCAPAEPLDVGRRHAELFALVLVPRPALTHELEGRHGQAEEAR